MAFIILPCGSEIFIYIKGIDVVEALWACVSSGCAGEASGATPRSSLLTPLILLRVIRGWNWSQHCARQPWKAKASLQRTLLSVRPQKRNFRTALYSDNDNVHVDTTVQPADFDPVAVRQHN